MYNQTPLVAGEFSKGSMKLNPGNEYNSIIFYNGNSGVTATFYLDSVRIFTEVYETSLGAIVTPASALNDDINCVQYKGLGGSFNDLEKFKSPIYVPEPTSVTQV